MSRLFASILFAYILSVGVGCQSNKACDMSAKDCSHCKDPSAKGSCPQCDTQKAADGMTNTNAAAGDVCSHCPGNQAAAADGSCPVCHAKPQ